MWQTWKDEQSGRQLQETAGTRGVFTSITLNDEVGNSLGGRPIRRPSRRGRWGRPPRRISEWNRDIFHADRKRNNGVVHRRYQRYRLNSKTEIGEQCGAGVHLMLYERYVCYWLPDSAADPPQILEDQGDGKARLGIHWNMSLK